MSHVKNVEAFGKLIGICTGLGENYTPGQQNLSLLSLNSMLENAKLALNNVQTAAANVANITNTREVVFESMRKLAQRVVSELKSSGVPIQTLTDARAVNRKLSGYRISRDPIVPEESKGQKKSHRARGGDFVTQAENFNLLIKLVSMTPRYTPAREELKPAALETLAAALVKANQDVNEAYAAVTHARRLRNDLLYRVTDNMAELSRLVKSHVRAVSGYQSGVFKMVTRIEVKIPANL